MSDCGIYYIKNKINGKMYIGQSVSISKDRIPAHLSALKSGRHFNSHLQKAFIKYGEESFEFGTLEECAKEDLNEKEVFYINHFSSSNPKKGYNLSLGGESVMKGRKHDEESKKKMSKSHILLSDNLRREKISSLQIGRKRKNSSSSYHGVSRRIVNKKDVYFRSVITFKGKTTHIGNFKNEVDAAVAYNNFIIDNRLPHPLNTIIQEVTK